MKMKKNKLLLFEISIVLLLISSYIAIRSIHFPSHLNFSSEQAAFSLKSLQLYRAHAVELIGPPISFRIGARYLFQGSLTYYVMMLFLILGKWDPIISSYLLVLFGAAMIIPLYIGARLLSGKKAAFLVSTIFVLLPFYVDYSRFFWNPNLQFLCTPLVILMMGLYQKYKKSIFLFLISFFAGVLLLFHYQYVLVILGLIIYYLYFVKGLTLKRKALFIFGFPVGFLPTILFEVRNQFYNLQTLFLFLQNYKQLFHRTSSTSIGSPHFILSISLFILILISGKISKFYSYFFLICTFFLLSLISFLTYYPLPTHGFGMAVDWNYALESQVHAIIKSEKIINYNIVNLGYDTVATVQKYLMVKEGSHENFDDYYHNAYLYLITDSQEYMKNPAYEINTFRPNRIIKSWKLNERYRLYLLQRMSE